MISVGAAGADCANAELQRTSVKHKEIDRADFIDDLSGRSAVFDTLPKRSGQDRSFAEMRRIGKELFGRNRDLAPVTLRRLHHVLGARSASAISAETVSFAKIVCLRNSPRQMGSFI